ncbi:hypothetical protein ACLOJK_041532 [Asimina triloba]
MAGSLARSLHSFIRRGLNAAASFQIYFIYYTSTAAVTSSGMQFPDFLLWREFLWGGLAGAFGEGVMHPIDTIKTRIQSQAVIRGCQNQMSIFQMVRTVWVADGLRGFYRGVSPGVTGSLATGATYFGVIESTKKWVEDIHPNLRGHWAHFIAGAIAVNDSGLGYFLSWISESNLKAIFQLDLYLVLAMIWSKLALLLTVCIDGQVFKIMRSHGMSHPMEGFNKKRGIYKLCSTVQQIPND